MVVGRGLGKRVQTTAVLGSMPLSLSHSISSQRPAYLISPGIWSTSLLWAVLMASRCLASAFLLGTHLYTRPHPTPLPILDSRGSVWPQAASIKLSDGAGVAPRPLREGLARSQRPWLGEAGLQACLWPSEASGGCPLSPAAGCLPFAPVKPPHYFLGMSCREAAGIWLQPCHSPCPAHSLGLSSFIYKMTTL